ncbi:beta-eliminating lyase-related protein [Streptomyces tibetensis]|uniref:Beta-eliminating lyase-related protein n=1 Tax=Streptomyces tibetensis TaxID=2382123 RepID=A0ABW6MR78_9ACTN
MLFLDAARFAENACLVTQHEAAYRDMSPRQVAEQAFRMADGCLMSAKKDGIVHIGGFLGMRDSTLAERCELLLIATEGIPTYGGLAGRDLDMIARGLTEVTEPCSLRARADAASHLARLTREAGIAIVEPPGLHALYLNAGRLLPHIAAHRFPGHALASSSISKAASARWNWAPSTLAARTRTAPRSPQRPTSWSGSRSPDGRTGSAT